MLEGPARKKNTEKNLSDDGGGGGSLTTVELGRPMNRMHALCKCGANEYNKFTNEKKNNY